MQIAHRIQINIIQIVEFEPILMEFKVKELN